MHEAVDEAGGLPHVVGRPLDPGHAPNFAQKVPDLADAADDVLEHLEDADGAQGPAQTHAHVTHTPDDVLDALEACAGLLKVRKVTLPLFGNSKIKAHQSS